MHGQRPVIQAWQRQKLRAGSSKPREDVKIDDHLHCFDGTKKVLTCYTDHMIDELSPHLSETPNQDRGEQIKPHDLTRRDFLRHMRDTAIAFALAGALPEQARSEETLQATVEQRIFDRAKYTELRFTTTFRELGPGEQAICRAILDYNSNILTAMGVPKSSGSQPNQQIETSGTLDEPGIDLSRRELWQALTQYLPRYHGEPYSLEQFLHAVAEDLPKALAAHGIFTKFKANFAATESMVISTTSIVCLPIHELETQTVNRWGKTFDTQLLTVGESIKVDGRPVFDGQGNASAQQSYYRNVILYKSVLQRNTEKEEADLEESVLLGARLSRVSREFALRKSLQSKEGASKNPVHLALALGMLRLMYQQQQLLGPSIDKHKDAGRKNDTTHETGHIYDQRDPAWEHHFEQINPKSGRDFLVHFYNESVHEEIDGFLTELRYNPDKITPLTNLMNGVLNDNTGNNTDDFEHARAHSWIYQEMSRRIKQKLNVQGTSTTPNGLEVDTVIAMNFDMLADSPKELEQLADEIWQYHRTQFSAMLANDKISSFDQSIQLSHYVRYAAYGIGALAAGYLGREFVHFLKRREHGINAERVREAVATFSQKKKIARLIPDLQLEKRSLNESEAKSRQQALQAILRVCESAPDGQMLIEPLKQYMDEKAKTHLPQNNNSDIEA